MNKLINLSARLLKIFVIGVPMLVVAAYLAFAAANRYVSEARVAVQHAGGDSAASLPGAALLLAGVNPPSRTDALFVQQYIHSTALLQALDKEFDLRGHYSAEKVDLLFLQKGQNFLLRKRRKIEFLIHNCPFIVLWSLISRFFIFKNSVHCISGF